MIALAGVLYEAKRLLRWGGANHNLTPNGGARAIALNARGERRVHAQVLELSIQGVQLLKLLATRRAGRQMRVHTLRVWRRFSRTARFLQESRQFHGSDVVGGIGISLQNQFPILLERFLRLRTFTSRWGLEFRR